MNISVTKRNVKPSATQLVDYKSACARKTINRAHVPNTRFGKIAFATDSDVDG